MLQIDQEDGVDSYGSGEDEDRGRIESYPPVLSLPGKLYYLQYSQHLYHISKKHFIENTSREPHVVYQIENLLSFLNSYRV